MSTTGKGPRLTKHRGTADRKKLRKLAKQKEGGGSGSSVPQQTNAKETKAQDPVLLSPLLSKPTDPAVVMDVSTAGKLPEVQITGIPGGGSGSSVPQQTNAKETKAQDPEKRMLPESVFILTAIAAIKFKDELGNAKKHIVQLTQADASSEISITFFTEAPNELLEEIKQKVRERDIILSFLETVRQVTVE